MLGSVSDRGESIVSLLELRLPDGFEQAVHLTRAELESQVRLMAALKMFELGKLSSGKAAELAGVSRVEFFDLCGRCQVPIIQYDGTVLPIASEMRERGYWFSDDLLEQTALLANEEIHPH